MSKLSLLISILAITCTSAFAQYNEITSSWSAEQKTIDGQAADWSQEFQYNSINASFAVSNDNEYFYLIFKTSDQSIQRKIMRSGMSVSVRGKGGNKNMVKILFPLKQDDKEAINRPRQEPGNTTQLLDNRKEMQNRFIQSCTEMKVKGIKSLKGTVPLENESGLFVALNWNEDNILSYELKVPIEELTSNSDPAELEEIEVKLTIFIKAPAQASGQGTGMRSGGGRGGSMGGGRPGGGSMMGGGRPGGGSAMGGGRPGDNSRGGSVNSMMSNDIFKSKITLSNPVR